jgi:putative heme-binding domain-containing protein
MYRSIMCATCHRFNGDGGSIGPDLTGSGNRYTLRDLLENIIDPSKVISDQYDSHEITKKDGSVLIGRIVVEENEKVFLMTNPFAPNDHLAINEIRHRQKRHPQSQHDAPRPDQLAQSRRTPRSASPTSSAAGTRRTRRSKSSPVAPQLDHEKAGDAPAFFVLKAICRMKHPPLAFRCLHIIP